MFVSMRMERRLDDSVISLVSVSRTDSAFVQTPEAFVDCLRNIVLLRLKQRLLPVAHSFTVLMLLLHWQREIKSKVLPFFVTFVLLQ